MLTDRIRSHAARALICLGASLALTACGGGGSAGTSSGSSGSGSSPSSYYSVGGTVSGLSASGLVLTDNGGDNLSVSSGASAFTFATKLLSGSSYAVAVATQPTGETCTVSSGSGTVSADVSSVAVACTVDSFTVGGNITGLSASGLVLLDNGTDSLSVSSGAGTFQFATALAYGKSYDVTISAQPAGETCTVGNGTGTATATVNSVTVSCVVDTYAIGGNVTGLNAAGLVLLDNGGDHLSVPSGAATFQFATPLAYGSAYDVTIGTQPTGETCAVGNGTGTATATVNSVTVTCTINNFTISGTVTGLTSAGLKLQDYTGGETLPIAAGQSTFTFTQAVAYGTNIDITVAAEPTWQNCTASASNFSGPVTSNVTGESVSCVSSTAASVSTLAGSTTAGNLDGAGTAAAFHTPDGVAYDPATNDLIVADSVNNEIRQITPSGVVTTLAGTGSVGHADGPVATATFDEPEGVAVDASGNIFVADKLNNEIREISGGNVTTFAGQLTSGSLDGTGTAASFYNPEGVAVDAKGNVYVADSANDEIREISPSGVVTTLAGSTVAGSADGTGAAAQFTYPTGVALDTSGNVYVADAGNNEIRKIAPGGVVTTIAGTTAFGHADGLGSLASFSGPTGVAVDSAGNIYVADSANSEIRVVAPTGLVSTLTGSYAATGTQDGSLAQATFNGPSGIAIDPSGNLYVGDSINNEIRKITP